MLDKTEKMRGDRLYVVFLLSIVLVEAVVQIAATAKRTNFILVWVLSSKARDLLTVSFHRVRLMPETPTLLLLWVGGTTDLLYNMCTPCWHLSDGNGDSSLLTYDLRSFYDAKSFLQGPSFCIYLLQGDLCAWTSMFDVFWFRIFSQLVNPGSGWPADCRMVKRDQAEPTYVYNHMPNPVPLLLLWSPIRNTRCAHLGTYQMATALGRSLLSYDFLPDAALVMFLVVW